MAHAEKQTYSRAVPAGAKIVTRGRRQCAAWTGRGGRKIVAPLVEGDPTRCLVETAKYYAIFSNGRGGVGRVPGTTDRTSTLQLAVELEQEARARRLGLTVSIRKQAARPLAEHLDDYEAILRARDRTERHVRMTRTYISRILEGCRFVYPADLEAAPVASWLAGRRAARMSASQSNHYLRAAKSLTRWLWRQRRLPDDPLAGLDPVNEATDRRRLRRALPVEELAWLIDCTAQSGRPFRKLSGPDRAILYRTAAYTGLRASELASLTPESFELDGAVPRVHLAAEFSKRRSHDTVPLFDELVGELRTWLAGRSRAMRCWPGNWTERGARMLARDMRAARSRWIRALRDRAERRRRRASAFLVVVDDRGRVFDFHALRGQLGSMLAAAGVHPKKAQRIMRHSDINLTMRLYTHLELADEAEAVSRLPALAGRPRRRGKAL